MEEYGENFEGSPWSLLKSPSSASYQSLQRGLLWLLVHFTLENACTKRREAANTISVEVFTRWKMLIGDCANNKSYGFFYRVGDKHPAPDPIVEPEGNTKYVEYLRMIRPSNTISYIKSRDEISEISEHVPACIYEWIGDLLMFLPKLA